MCSSRRHGRGFEATGRRPERFDGTARRHERPAEPPADMRVGDADREEALVALRRHAGEGRLSAEELEERVEAALNARTHGELRALFGDLPDDSRRIARQRVHRRANSGHFRVYLAVSALLIAIWALTGAGYFWPIWAIAGWGIVFLMPGCSPRRSHRMHRGEAIRV